MNKFEKISLAFSCFLPLYFIFGIQNVMKAISLYQKINNNDIFRGLSGQNAGFRFNAILGFIWSMLILLSIGGILFFIKKFLEAPNRAKDTVVLLKADNITAEYYFNYFSLFVISFFTVDPTEISDILILGFLVLLIIVVYIRNDMFFVNPILNLIGYKSFNISYRKIAVSQMENRNRKDEIFEIKVFSKENLNRALQDEYFVTFSPHDFSVCYSKNKFR